VSYKPGEGHYIDLSEKTSKDSREVAPGIVLDFDENGNFVSIDIDQASKFVNLTSLETTALPADKYHILA